MKYALACVLMFGMGLTAEAQHRPAHHAPVVVQHRLQHTTRHYSFRYVHTPNVLIYGQIAQYQQFGFAIVGYSDLVAVQGVCTQYGFQIVRVNPVQQFVVVRLPVTYSWNTIVTFSRVNHVRFVEPARRHYR
jgi:hypothetical protein